MIRYQRVVIWSLVYTLLAGMSAAYADKVFLKDGTVQESEKVWQSEGYVHFILRGTKGVVIRYSKGIVDRVQVDGVVEIIHTTENDSGSAADATAKPEEATAGRQNILKTGSSAGTNPPIKAIVIDPKFIRSHNGVSFYDPRRPMRYWASKDSKHRSLEAAIESLAHTYGQTAKWIESHMGEENDLGVIHKNLMAQQGSAPELKTENNAVQPVSNRPHPDKPKSTGSGAPERKTKAILLQRADPDNQGVAFYNPRRKEKYWAGKGKRYNTLDGALQALAQQYGVTVEWVERHMGDTNDLMEIHQNIIASLDPK